ncbi:MAG: M36 family metallopeptidase [Flavobacteriales bacterium]|nr:M36 family metallopeptidase [Flavobacteriales bacterium]
MLSPLRFVLIGCLLLSGSYLFGQALPLDPLSIARNELENKGIRLDAIGELVVRDAYTDRRTGILHAYLRQHLNGLDVFGTEVALHILPDGRVVGLHQRLIEDLVAKAPKTAPGLTPEEALRAALLIEELPVARIARVEGDGASHRYVFSREGIASEDPVVQLYLMPVGEKVSLVWNVTLYLLDGSHWWNIRIDATTGKELERNDWVAQCEFDGVGEHAHGTPVPLAPAPAAPADLRVFARPAESPNHGAHALLNAPWNAALNASPFGWNDVNGAAGAEYTITRGNNVYASEDRDNNNVPGFSPDGGATLDFDFPANLALDPLDYESAAITNLFYWNNIIHDVTYQYGFDEVSGNFQLNNYGNGGAGNDEVDADAQDGSGTNNANFGTPPDGSSPRMQMFRWTQTTPARDSDLDNGIIVHEYGHGISNRLVGGPSNTSCLFNAEQMGEGWSDYFGLMLTIEPGDQGTDARGIGTYVLGQPVTGLGIRPSPYSTNFGVNAYTYASTNSGLSQPHGIGFVWCTMLWELTWDLIAQYGFDPDIYNGTGGNNIAMQLVMDGLKLTPCGPGFVDGRDAILMADQINNSGANQQLIWAAFARRGLGFSASQGSASSRSDQVEAFDVPLDVNVGVTAIVEPTSSSYPDCLNNARTVKVKVRNNGLTAQSNIPVVYRLDNGALVTEVLVGPVASGITVDFTFATPLVIAGLGAHTMKAWTALVGDLNQNNDSTSIGLELVTGTPQSTPFLETFESAALCGTASNCGATVCALPNGWRNLSNGTFDASDWRVDENDTPSGSTGPALDFAPGTATGNYVYLEASACFNSDAVLLSPCIDLSGVILPRLRYAQHLYGAAMGSLHVDLFDGSQWHLDIAPVVQGDQGDIWQQRTVNLDAYANAIVMIRFRGRTGSDFTSDMALDAIEIYDGAIPPVADLSATPSSWCVGGKATLTDLSANDPTGWNWSITPATHQFVDGTNASSEQPKVLFTAPGVYDITLTATNAFGQDSHTQTSAVTIGTGVAARMDVNLDRWGAETTWSLKRLNGTTVASGGPYTTVGQNGVYPQPPQFLCLDQDSCYVLQVNDSYGDGMCCAYGQGGYLLSLGTGDTLVYGNGQFTFQRTDTACLIGAPSLSARLILEGPYLTATGLMRDQLRSQPSFPLVEPYTSLGFSQPQGGGESVDPGLLTITGPNAIVDWVRVEFRDAVAPSIVVGAIQVLLQSDGDLVTGTGIADLVLPIPNGNYYVAFRHRNHLGAMTSAPVAFASGPVSLDLTDPLVPTFGTNARKSLGTVMGLWSGNVVSDVLLKYAGGANDRDPILIRIGGSVPTSVVSGYWPEDVTLDAQVKYAGSSNDRDPILQNIGGSIPTAVRAEQLP